MTPINFDEIVLDEEELAFANASSSGMYIVKPLSQKERESMVQWAKAYFQNKRLISMRIRQRDLDTFRRKVEIEYGIPYQTALQILISKFNIWEVRI